MQSSSRFFAFQFLNFDDFLYSSEHKFTHLLFTFSCVGIDIVRNIYRSSNISQVVNAMVDALTSDPPLDRYIVGIDARGLQ